ncbi:MAG TPA: phage minor capsid protein [Candidatus Eisenbergiella pullicola]|nr:phage minor capsid protein [Candidatus Eisenbergiella pullicola]
MTQGQLEQLPAGVVKIFDDLEMQILTDIVRRLKVNGFSTATADWQITRLQQMGESEEEIRKWIQEALKATDAEMEKIFSDEVYEQYMGHERAYKAKGLEQIPYKDNIPLQEFVSAVEQQTAGVFQNMTASMGFAIRSPSGKIQYSPLMDFYQTTLDQAVAGIQTGAFSYQGMLERTINRLTSSGVRWIDYDSGHHNRIDVAARRAVMTGFRQVQGRINEQTAAALGTDTYEVAYHVGARPSHQPWQGRVWTMAQLRSVCGLGTVTGLHGANCYHDYDAFIPGVSERVYTDEQLEEMIQRENTPKTYNGRQYTTYEALQQQRAMETAMRKTRQDIRLLEEGGSDEEALILRKARYQGQLQTYRDFSDKMDLPVQMDRVYQDGLKGRFTPTKNEIAKLQKNDKIEAKEWTKDAVERRMRDEKIIQSLKREKAVLYDNRGRRIFQKNGQKHSISFTEKEIGNMKGGVLTHNHPGGATFSPADINMLRTSGLAEIRAVGRDGVYVLKQPKSWSAQIASFADLEKQYDKIAAELKDQMERWAMDNLDKIDVTDYQIRYQDEILKELSKRFNLDYRMEELSDEKT